MERTWGEVELIDDHGDEEGEGGGKGGFATVWCRLVYIGMGRCVLFTHLRGGVIWELFVHADVLSAGTALSVRIEFVFLLEES